MLFFSGSIRKLQLLLGAVPVVLLLNGPQTA